MNRKFTKICITITVVMLSVSQVNAKIWRVNNQAGINADYNSLVLALGAANVKAGDTIHLEGSPTVYNSGSTITVSKKLTIIGSGYFLNDNPQTQANKNASIIETLTFASGSEGSVIMGLSIINSNKVNLQVNTNNITISRCYIKQTGAYNCIKLSSLLSNIIIDRCFITNSTTTSSISFGSGNGNCIISNNIIRSGTKTAVKSAIDSYNTNSSLIFTNNVVIGTWNCYGSILKNNIHINGTVSNLDLNTAEYNIGHSTQFGTANGNKENITMTAVFEYTGTEDTDAHYMLKAGSPAIGAGMYGYDCGAFGGSAPYVLSGMPSVPAIFEAVVPTATNSSGILNVDIDAKVHQ